MAFTKAPVYVTLEDVELWVKSKISIAAFSEYGLTEEQFSTLCWQGESTALRVLGRIYEVNPIKCQDGRDYTFLPDYTYSIIFELICCHCTILLLTINFGENQWAIADKYLNQLKMLANSLEVTAVGMDPKTKLLISGVLPGLKVNKLVSRALSLVPSVRVATTRSPWGSNYKSALQKIPATGVNWSMPFFNESGNNE